jgi:hypothetical protein
MPKPSFLEAHRWELCKAFLERADKAGETLRVLLFTTDGAGIGFSLHQATNDGSKWHILAAVFFAISIVVVYWSWDLQKRKAVQRFQLVRDKGISAYLAWEHEETIEGVQQEYESNKSMDSIAAVILGLAVIFEGILAFVS